MHSPPPTFPFYSYCTLTHLYVVWEKESQEVVLVICDVTQRSLWRGYLFSLELPNSESIPLLMEKEAQRKISLQGYLPSPAQREVDVSKLEAEVESLLSEQKEAVLKEENPDLFSPIGTQMFKDPVDVCAGKHTFDRDEINRWRLTSNKCPLCRTPLVEEPTSNQEIKRAAEEALQSLTSMLSLPNAKRRKRDSSGYAQVPVELERQGQQEKAILAYLKLAQYQLQEGENVAAFESILHCQWLKPPSFEMVKLGIKVALLAKQNPTLQVFTLAYVPKVHDDPSFINGYKELLSYSPTQWQLYFSLADLLSSKSEKLHYLLTGALRALEAGDDFFAEIFQIKMKEIEPDSWVVSLLDLEILKRKREAISAEVLPSVKKVEEAMTRLTKPESPPPILFEGFDWLPEGAMI